MKVTITRSNLCEIGEDRSTHFLLAPLAAVACLRGPLSLLWKDLWTSHHAGVLGVVTRGLGYVP